MREMVTKTMLPRMKYLKVATIVLLLTFTSTSFGWAQEIQNDDDILDLLPGILAASQLSTDYDGDGYTKSQGDCNDTNSAISPVATEICGDGIDQDCSGADRVCMPEETDDDGDGYTENQGDCRDDIYGINPGATDVCEDGIDQDCNGQDEACSPDPFGEPRLLFAEEDDGRSASGHYTIGDDRILVSAVGDFDGNGFDDILMTFPGYDDSSGNKVGSPIRIYLSNANGTLNEATNTIIEGSIPATQFTRRTFVADFNGDGIDDVFLANHGLELPSPSPGTDWHEPDTLLLSNPGGKLTDASSNLPANDFYSHGGAIGDIDGDGDIDILTNTNNWPPSGIQVYLNNGNGTFTLDNSGIPQVEYMPGYFTGVSGALWIELLDVDNDGDLDLFKAGNVPDDHYIALNNGNGDFSIEPPITLPPLKWWNFGIEGASVADFNLDGLSDLLLVETDSSSSPWNHELQLLISNGDGTFSDQTAARLPAPADVTTNTFTHIADLNQDGSPEVLFMLRQANNPLPDFYLNDGTGNFSRIGDGYLPDYFPASYHPIDLSNDGDIDFIISGLWSNELRISGTFVLESTRVPSF